jgi:hypothetical protein
VYEAVLLVLLKQVKNAVTLLLTETQRHEYVWGSGSIAPLIPNL